VLVVCAAMWAGGSVARADDLEAAKAHFAVAQAYYDEANYADALKEFKEAYRLSKRPALLYNIGACHERLDQLSDAIEAFEQYLREMPTASDRVQVQTRIKNLAKRRDERAAAKSEPPPKSDPPPKSEPPPEPPAKTAPAVPPTTVATTSPAPDDRPRKRLATWIVGGIGLGLLAGGLVAGVTAHVQYQDLEKMCQNNVCPADHANDISAGRGAGIAADVLWPLGAAAVVTSVVLFFVEGKSRRAPTPAAWTPVGVGRRRAAIRFLP
jgi:tetratricopeptide (TPR) repeat protein